MRTARLDAQKRVAEFVMPGLVPGGSGDFHQRGGPPAAAPAKRGVKPGEFVLIHRDNWVEGMRAWFAGGEPGATGVPPNPRWAPGKMKFFAGLCGAVAAITNPAYA